jgi:DNA polymerase III sliding clamp (beta) subunit (PCNA family)
MSFDLKQLQDKLSSVHTVSKYSFGQTLVRYQNKKVFLVRLNNEGKTDFIKNSPVIGLDLGGESFQLSYATFMKLSSKDGEIINDTIKAGKVSLDLDIDTKDIELPDYKSLDADIILSYNDFLDIFKKVSPFAATYETNNILGTINFKTCDNKSLEVAATDGNRLVVLKNIENLCDEAVTNYNLQTCDIKKLSKVLKLYKTDKAKCVMLSRLNNDTIILSLGDNYDSYPISSAGGSYPRYDQFIPLSNRVIYMVNSKKLIESLNEIEPFVNERTKLVYINFEDENLFCYGDKNKKISVEYAKSFEQTNDEYINKLAFNLHYLLQALKTFDPNLPLTFSGNGALSPWLMEQGDHIHLIMTVQTKD